MRCAPNRIRTGVTGLKSLQGFKGMSETLILERFEACYRGRLLAVVLAELDPEHFRGL